MHKIYVTELYDENIEVVFKKISDHSRFLSGGGLTCKLLKEGSPNKNGNGAIRQVVSPQLTFEEHIFDYQLNKHFAYIITSMTPNKPIKHIKGWLDFSQDKGKVRVEWHSHFKVTIPIVGRLIGWFVKRGMAKVFQNRLKFIK